MQLSLWNYQHQQIEETKILNREKNIELDVNDKFKYGQFFTKKEIVKKVLGILFTYKKYEKEIKILEPSFGTGNFIKVLEELEFNNIDGCEIDPKFINHPMDFFNFPLNKKYDLIIGNPPFTKYNIKESYYYKEDYINANPDPESYLIRKLLKKEKEKIENVFILKSLKHLKDKNSSMGFVLPISFFIKNKNKEIKEELIKYFSTIIIYQNREVWFEYHIPCCFAIFTNTEIYKNKIILTFDDNGERYTDELDISKINEELIPQIHFNKVNGIIKNHEGIPLSQFLSDTKIEYKKSYKENNVSGKNILNRNKILSEDVENYKLAIVRVGNASVGRCGLINVKKDILNDMFYVFDFKKGYNKSKKIKEDICNKINERQDYFKNSTIRVGSKSIKKEDILNFRVKI